MVPDDAALMRLTEQAAAALQQRGWQLAAAESCTGGWLAKTATDLPGSSRWFERGFVTYSNEAKQELLGVSAATLATHGAVSAATVQEMAAGVLAHSRADVSVAISGIAGPGGGSADKPVGLVWFGWAVRGQAPRVAQEHFTGDRESVRRQAVKVAWQGILALMDAS